MNTSPFNQTVSPESKFGKHFTGHKKKRFNPDREFITDAVEEFLKNGGKIEESKLPSYEEFINLRSCDRGAGSFLLYGHSRGFSR